MTLGYPKLNELTEITFPIGSDLLPILRAGVLQRIAHENLTTSPALSIVAAADLAAGDFVSLAPGGAILADATDDTRPANGYVLVSTAAGATATVFLGGSVNSALTGLTAGALYFLGVGGTVTASQPTTGALQIVGTAADSTHLVFHPQPAVLL